MSKAMAKSAIKWTKEEQSAIKRQYEEFIRSGGQFAPGVTVPDLITAGNNFERAISNQIQTIASYSTDFASYVKDTDNMLTSTQQNLLLLTAKQTLRARGEKNNALTADTTELEQATQAKNTLLQEANAVCNDAMDRISLERQSCITSAAYSQVLDHYLKGNIVKDDKQRKTLQIARNSINVRLGILGQNLETYKTAIETETRHIAKSAAPLKVMSVKEAQRVVAAAITTAPESAVEPPPAAPEPQQPAPTVAETEQPAATAAFTVSKEDVVTDQKSFALLEQLESKLELARAQAFEAFIQTQFAIERQSKADLTIEAYRKQDNLQTLAEQDKTYLASVAKSEQALYGEVTKALENAPKIEWTSTEVDKPNVQEFKDTQGKLICAITSLEKADTPAPQVQVNGQNIAISRRRELTLPKHLEEDQGPRYMAFALKDSSGRNMPKSKALYLTAQYKEDGTLQGITHPKPVKFAGDIAYIEHEGQIFTLPVNKQELEALQQQVTQNKGVEAGKNITLEQEAADLTLTSTVHTDTPSVALEVNNPELATSPAAEPDPLSVGAFFGDEGARMPEADKTLTPKAPSFTLVSSTLEEGERTNESAVAKITSIKPPTTLKPPSAPNIRPAVASLTINKRDDMHPAAVGQTNALMTIFDQARNESGVVRPSKIKASQKAPQGPGRT